MTLCWNKGLNVERARKWSFIVSATFYTFRPQFAAIFKPMKLSLHRAPLNEASE